MTDIKHFSYFLPITKIFNAYVSFIACIFYSFLTNIQVLEFFSLLNRLD